jgi:hypothetical protein
MYFLWKREKEKEKEKTTGDKPFIICLYATQQ